MTKQQNTNKLYDKILNEQNIYSAIYSLESYVFDKGLLDTEVPIAFPDENGETRYFAVSVSGYDGSLELLEF